MVNKYSQFCKILSVDYYNDTILKEGQIQLKIGEFKFGEGNKSYISNPFMIYCLNKNTFFRFTSYNWDGTKKGAKQIKKNLEGKVFEIDYGFKL